MLDTRELDRRAGSEKRVDLTVPAPGGMGNAAIGVPEGSPVHLHLGVDSVIEGFWVSGTVTASAAGECVRCLDPLQADVATEVEALYVHSVVPGGAAAEDGEGPPDGEDVFALDGDLLDLEQAVRDAVVLDLPLLPVCSPDCAGLNADGSRADTAAPPPPPLDPRWASLALLQDPTRTDHERRSATLEQPTR